MSVDYAAIGRRIKERRRALGRTQEWLAERLQVSVGYVSQIERGVTRVSLDTLSDIGGILGCDLGALVAGTARQEPDYLESELRVRLSRMSAKQRALLMEMADLLLEY